MLSKMTILNVIVLATVLGHVTCISRGFIPSSEGCGREILQYGCECHTISGLVITCKDLDLEHWPRFGDMGAVDVDMLDISGNAFDHIPSNTFGDLRISNLVMSNNRNMFRNSNVSNVFNEHQVSTLLYLDLRDNGFGSIPNFINSLTSLRTLNLVGNNINTIPNSMMASSPDLTELRLGNVIHVEDEAFQSTPNLKVLEIRPQSTDFIFTPEFLGPMNTQYLQDLESLIIRDSPKVYISKELQVMPSLVHLELVKVSIHDLQLMLMRIPSAYPTMRTINMHHNELTVISHLFLAHFEGLESIDFSHNRIKAVYTESFYANAKLRHVDLSHCRLSFVQSGSFSALTRLEVLDLSHNRLRSLAADTLPENWAHLVVFLASNNFWCVCDIQWLMNAALVQHVGGQSLLDPYEVDHELRCDNRPGDPLMYTAYDQMADYCRF